MTSNIRWLNALGALVCAALMAYALYAQHGLGLEPCPLCIFQRVAVVVLGFAFLLAALHPARRVGRRVHAVVIALVAAAGAGVAGSSLQTMLDAKQAPAQIKGTTLRILQWSHFIPAYDTWFDSKLTKEWGDKNGVKVRVDHIPHLELPARMAAEYAAGAGHDIIMNGSSILTRLYYKSLADLSDIYDAAGKKHGGWIPTAKALVEAEGHQYGIPLFYILLPMTYRKDLFDANGLKAPDTWDLARVAARSCPDFTSIVFHPSGPNGLPRSRNQRSGPPASAWLITTRSVVSQSVRISRTVRSRSRLNRATTPV